MPSQLELFRDHQVDIFFHFWDTVDEAEKRDIVACLKPRAYLFEKPRDFSYVDTDTNIEPDLINIPSRTLSQHYSWHCVGKLVEPFRHEYTLGMRSRSDLQFVHSINQMFPELKSSDILIPWWNEDQLLSDLFALGGIEPILYYHQLYDHVFDYLVGQQFNAELLLTIHFQRRPDIHVYAEKFQYFFVRRPHMTNYSIEQAMLENPGRNKWLDPEVVQSHASYHEQRNGEGGASYFKGFRHSQLTTLLDEVREKVEGKKPG